MDTFISLAQAARLLAGNHATDESVEIWHTLLIKQADKLNAVKRWVAHRDALPGGIAFDRSPEEWRIPLQTFKAWCETNGYTRQSQPRKETPESRRQRLRTRRDELKSKGAKDWQRQMAKEEGVTCARIRQLLSEPKREESPPFGLPSPRKRKRK